MQREKLKRFVNGLRPDIMKDVKLHEPTTYTEALRKDFVSEEAIEDIKRETQLVSVEGKPDNLKHQASHKKQKIGAKPIYNLCGGSHHSNQCRKKPGVCYGCGKEGHRVKDCPEGRESFCYDSLGCGNGQQCSLGYDLISNHEASTLFDSGSINALFFLSYFRC